jgi:hypothetical protein
MEKPVWYKIKGYYHISPPLKLEWSDFSKTIQKIKNPKFVAQYAFFPLLHTNIIERKYKKHPTQENKRCHSYKIEGGIKNTEKIRPLHYANHLDALIFGYYAFLLQERYESKLRGINGLSECITAYRKIPIENSDKHKGTINFAHEAFSEIRIRTRDKGKVGVLAFDIKSFFSSLDHNYLREKWVQLMGFDTMPSDHESVLNAATNFSFIYKDDLRKLQKTRGRRSNFDEQRLAKIANKKGFSAFFDSPKDFRENVKSGKIHVFKNNFRNDNKQLMGIPQGLPISAILANMYLLDFDMAILELVKEKGCYYRRYSDDIVIVCDEEYIPEITEFVNLEMKKCHVKISEEKTETFFFQKRTLSEKEEIFSSKLINNVFVENRPFSYLGFEFYGEKTLIKSANLSKFYRRMIYAVKAKSKIAHKVALRDSTKPILFKKQLYSIYRNIDLDKVTSTRRFKRFIPQETGEFRLTTREKTKPLKGNYFSYAQRAAEIMNESAILKQIAGEKRVFNQAIQKHFNKK